ncbi:MAG TPA: hypothetical protein VKK81_08020 [Candidatus Binatia bacterium]|nr:hypothetical protein [Candidatus Binatia bacterium]
MARQILYTMQFKGQAVPANDAGTVLKATTTAPSCTITTVVGATGVSGSLQPTAGGQGRCESQVTFTGETSFQEAGSITFGDNQHRLYFSTVGQGYIGASADPQLKHGAVIWKVERGEGQFAGATGLITSNFFVSSTGEVTDNHFGVLFIK